MALGVDMGTQRAIAVNGRFFRPRGEGPRLLLLAAQYKISVKLTFYLYNQTGYTFLRFAQNYIL
ncbi:hypothetical protein SAMN04488513_101666 [Pseudozobellia thermophila]|uniref:Uncharacterized protein n=1 Tax=Pseudozobellia thermophila TaxID=192903 RepID=A0A1M6C750_9FLAO|nr:hypothetical protein SAMN04488513_101666 [Pseudozobellia thermophila]